MGKASTQPSTRIPRFSSLDLVQTSVKPQRLARRIAVALGVLAVLFVVLPWQQTAPGKGRIIAWAPADRQQSVDAPITGVVERWDVREGQRVTAGDPLVELRDNDPAMFQRLEAERATLVDRQVAADAKVEAYRSKVDAVRSARDAAVSSAEAKMRLEEQEIDAAREKRTGDAAAMEAAELNLRRTLKLHEKGLKSTFDVEQAQLRFDTAKANLAQSEAKVQAAKSKLDAARLDRAKAIQEGDAKILDAEGSLQEALASSSASAGRLLDMDVEIDRQRAQVVHAPRDGVVHRVYGGQGGEQVKAGDSLLVIVPDTESRAVELTVDGNDVPLVRQGQNVRLQFEGWPAIQFAGWPSVAIGTFGGRIAFIDAASDNSGNFRVMVEPDPNEPAWPSTAYLRQGVSAKGWVLLAQVPVGFELWRQLNNFPPAVSPPPTPSKGGSDAPKAKKDADYDDKEGDKK